MIPYFEPARMRSSVFDGPRLGTHPALPTPMISKLALNIHRRAQAHAQSYKRKTAQLLISVEEVDRNRVFSELACNSTFEYCITHLDLPQGVAYDLINVMRKAREVPELRVAVEQGLELSKARRIVPLITPENQAEWIRKALELPRLQLEREVAAVNPQWIEREVCRPSAKDRVKIEFFTSEQRHAALVRAQDLVSTSLGENANFDATIAFVVEHFLATKDPVVKAERNVGRVNASVKTKVLARDGGRCQMKLPGGRRCGHRRFLHVHHKRSRYHGGVDHPDNLTTLCAGCHRAWHLRYGDVPLYRDKAFGPDG